MYRQYALRGYVRLDLPEQLPRIFGEYHPIFSANYPIRDPLQVLLTNPVPVTNPAPVPEGPSMEELLEYCQQLKAAQAAARTRENMEFIAMVEGAISLGVNTAL